MKLLKMESAQILKVTRSINHENVGSNLAKISFLHITLFLRILEHRFINKFNINVVIVVILS